MPVPVPGIPTRSESLPRAKRYEARQLRTGVASTVPSAVSVAVPTRGFFNGGGTAEPAGTAAAAIIYETARLLRLYPLFNACYAGDNIRYYEQVHVGYAVDLGQGLKVPVIKDADTKSLRQIADEKQRLVVDYLSDSLSLDALTGGTFTVTDLSGEGVAHFQPLLNAGQSAILGICAETYPGGDGSGSFNLVLAFDHQVAEGRSAAAFLRDLRDRVRAHEASWRINHDAALPEPHCGTCLRPVAELEAARQFLVRTVREGGREALVCTLCLQDW
jgi:2-oxoglutarate dehydrogenase E2 component (dihydrolipoamide succinyltransferase)